MLYEVSLEVQSPGSELSTFGLRSRCLSHMRHDYPSLSLRIAKKKHTLLPFRLAPKEKSFWTKNLVNKYPKKKFHFDAKLIRDQFGKEIEINMK